MTIFEGMLRLLLPSLLLLATLARAQEPFSLHYTVDDGLPSNEVYHVIEDKQGYIWLATDHGIARFDGYSFKNYSTGDGLVHNTVFGFYTDHRGRQWMRTFNSSLGYLENGKFHAYAQNEKLRTFLGRNFIRNFAFDKAGNLWFVSIRQDFGLYRQSAVDGSVERVKLRSGYNAAIVTLDSGEMIAAMDMQNGYRIADTADNALLHTGDTILFRMPRIPGADARALINCIQPTPGHYFFSYESHLAELKNDSIVRRIACPDLVNQIYAGSGGEIWLCGRGYQSLSAGGILSPMRMPKNLVTSMLRDSQGNFWIATVDDGIYLVRNMQVSVYGNNETIGLATYRDALLAFSYNGDLSRLSINNNGAPIDNHFLTNIPGALMFYMDTVSGQAHVDSRSYALDPELEKPPVMRNLALNCGSGGMRGFTRMGDTLLLAANVGWQMIRADGTPLYCSYDIGFSKFCTAISTDAAHHIWIGTTDGLYIFRNGKTEPWQHNNPLFQQRVTCIRNGTHGELIVSTRGGGIIVIDRGKVYNLRQTDGLSTDLCENVCVDDSIWWVCSNEGLNKVICSHSSDKLSFRVEKINVQHGLPSNKVNDAVRFGSLLVVATGKGIAWFDVRTLRLSQRPPAIYITGFQANNRLVNPQLAPLRWNDNNISVSFSALLFRSPGKVNYRYRLQGYETEWNYTNDRIARYFNLPPGDYTFLVSAMNENGVWNEAAAVQQFHIPAHYSQTWWFRTLIVLSVLLVFALGTQYYVRQRRLRERITSNLLLAELNTLRSQMKPHFIFNSLNSIQHFILEHDDEAAHLYLSRFSDLMRRILENTRKNSVSLRKEIDTLELYLDLEKLRFGENFNAVIHVAPDVYMDRIEVPPMLIQPYVENAIWHGLMLRKENPQLAVRFFMQDRALVCEVEDNGIGRAMAQELRSAKAHASTGMKNIEERVALLNHVSGSAITVEIVDLKHEDGTAAGTKVILRFRNIMND